MGRKGMDVKELNALMKKCENIMKVRYVTPTIHASFGSIVSVIIHTSEESKEFTITNNPDENFNLTEAVNEYLDNMYEKGIMEG